MKFGDIEGKGKVYSDSGEIIMLRGERLRVSSSGMLHRGWVRYKLGWRTILFKGYGSFNITNKRLVYIEVPEYIEKIHTFNLDHELGDFGGWDYHAHRMRRAVRLGALIFFELPLSEITEFKHGKKNSIIFVKDEKHKYKLVIELKIGHELDELWNKYYPSSN